jgi:hypothetical protein
VVKPADALCTAATACLHFGAVGWPVTCLFAGGEIGDASAGRHRAYRVRRLHGGADTPCGPDSRASPCPASDTSGDSFTRCATRDHGPAASRADPESRSATHHGAASKYGPDPERCAPSDRVSGTAPHDPGRHSARRAHPHIVATGPPDEPPSFAAAPRPLILLGRVSEEIARAVPARGGTIAGVE